MPDSQKLLCFKKEMAVLNSNIEIVGDYINARTKIACKCRVCNNLWESTPDNLKHKPRCPKCSGHYRRTQEDFVSDLKKINSNIIVIGKYQNTQMRVKVKCKKCGCEWDPIANSLLQGTGCPKCSHQMIAETKRLSEQVFLERIRTLNPDIEVLEQYKDGRTKIKCRCKKCGGIWAPVADSILRGTGCPVCAGNKRKTDIQFKEELHKVLPTVTTLEPYIDAHTQIKCRCEKCGNIWKSKPNNLLNGLGCKQCATRRNAENSRKDLYQLKEEVHILSPDIEILGEYVNAHTKIKCLCNYCGNIWFPLPMDLLKGTGCPNCSHSSTSFVEQFLLKAFRRVLGKNRVVSRDKKTIGKELDVYIPNLKLALEPGSWYWHSSKIVEDKEKQLLCRQNGIRLITIYDSYTEEEAPSRDDCLVFPFNLEAESNHLTLKHIISGILKEYEINVLITEEDFQKIEASAYADSRRISTEKFINKLTDINPTVEIIGEYKSARDKIQCRCKKCSFLWKSDPSHLLQGRGCPRCGGTQKLTQQEFKKRMGQINPAIKVVGTYSNNSTPVLVECKKCGNRWSARPGNLMMGTGCPQCARNQSSIRQRMSNESFLIKMREKGNPNTIVLEEYRGYKCKLECVCKECGNKWSATPQSLLQKHGCPECGRKKQRKQS